MFRAIAAAAIIMASVVAAGSPMSNGLVMDMSVRAPATFEYGDLAIVPTVVNVGETVNITLRVDNEGDLAGTAWVSLRLNGLVNQTQPVDLPGGEHRTVRFAVAPNVSGNYSVEVEGLTGAFVVRALPAPGVRWWLIIAIIVAAGVVAFLFMRGQGGEKASLKETLLRFLRRFKEEPEEEPKEEAKGEDSRPCRRKRLQNENK